MSKYVKKEKDFTKFNARKYLEDYYFAIRDVEKFLLNFYHQTYNKIHGKSLLEIGGGPTIAQLISASGHTDEIVFSEFSKQNRAEVIKFAKDKKPYNFDKFFKYVLSLEGMNLSNENMWFIKERLRKKISAVIPCDLRKKNPISTKRKFDVVSVNFCIESITDSEDEFKLFFRRAIQYLKPKGYLIMALLLKATSYSVGKHKFPAFSVDEKYMRKLLSKQFTDIHIRSIKFKAKTMKGNIALWARKR